LETLFEKRHRANGRGCEESDKTGALCEKMQLWGKDTVFFNLTTLEMRRIRGDLIEVFKIL
jgi:hypothetical protein